MIQYYDAAGRRRWETIGPNLHEARQVLAARMWERRNAKFRLDRQPITMKEFAAKWDEDYVTVQVRLGRMKESSAESCRSRLRLHVVPFFGPMRLDAITLPHVREFKALLAKELSPKTVLNVMVVLKEMLKHAVQWGYLDANPARYAERPRGEDQEMQILAPPEIRRLLDVADEPVRPLILCAVLTGMRRGELLGRQWEDIDLEGDRIFVRRALWRGKFVTPKSRRSRRTIDLAPTLKTALARLPSPFHGGLVFRNEDGTPLDPDNFAHRDWARVLRRAKLRRIEALASSPDNVLAKDRHHRNGVQQDMAYDHLEIEARWQRYWDEHGTFRAARRSGRPKRYVLDMFPYPSGVGLHVGHPEGYTATDIMARAWRMRGYHVLHPIGWDAFGLPAEQHAIESGQHPARTTANNIATFKR